MAILGCLPLLEGLQNSNDNCLFVILSSLFPATRETLLSLYAPLFECCGLNCWGHEKEGGRLQRKLALLTEKKANEKNGFEDEGIETRQIERLGRMKERELRETQFDPLRLVEWNYDETEILIEHRISQK